MSGRERRIDRRLEASTQVEFRQGERRVRGVLRNISRGGAAVEVAAMAPRLGEPVLLGIEPAPGLDIELPGVVIAGRRSKDPAGAVAYWAHIEFDALSGAQLAALARFMKRLLVQAAPASAQADQGFSENEIDRFFLGLKASS